MKFLPTELDGVQLVELAKFEDERGSFMETWREDQFSTAGIAGPWVQDNFSRSAQHVLRGIHYQVRQAQGKLVRVSSGRIYDVAVDLRQASSTFGQWTGHELDADRPVMLWIPPGFGHGFLTLSSTAHVAYKCTAYYAAEHDRTIIWNDPDIGIEWPLPDNQKPTVSEKDAAGLPLAEADLFE
ncbi:dTDP-4-dehydrorhamnose 3,5-epimerase [Parasphingopyxis sp. CP4]|uniref:dTDP-4-dehydrorhamnose 3,5-epimerase n=1 Tax=Parasphingopyxis sp. CP4 TaxID=2724527 RepID=UPI0015A4DAD2|nr:dTDP-4-dehydrorhamnose 3,5-epimerase [Parasphingopyxis sp. CP4]QLC21346.1 dTDP-4-dehydrorhamnose 3,5-epimerase [Parasphingopyxis sp. CP4]